MDSVELQILEHCIAEGEDLYPGTTPGLRRRHRNIDARLGRSTTYHIAVPTVSALGEPGLKALDVTALIRSGVILVLD